MGLGKSLNVISLIALHPHLGPTDSNMTVSGSFRSSKTTLLVVPLPRKSPIYKLMTES